MKNDPNCNPTRNGMEFLVIVLISFHCFSPKEEKSSNQYQVYWKMGDRKIQSSCGYENIYCLVKLQAHRLDLYLILFHTYQM